MTAYIGTSGNDNLTGSHEDDYLQGYEGDDTLNGGAGYDPLYGGEGNDSLDGGADHFGQQDKLYGGEGNDTLYALGWHGGDILEGGNGNDVYVIDVVENGYDPAAPTLIEAANAGIDSINSSATWTLGENFENLTLTGDAAINGTGNNLSNSLIGNNADNTLAGGEGNDFLNAGEGDDTLYGGVDDDQIFGGGGNDSLYGEAGNDLLYDSYGSDNLVGGVGNDLYHIGFYGEPDSRDLILEYFNEGTDTVEAYVDYTLDANVENLTLAGSTVNGIGNNLDNTITGNSADNTLVGGEGVDTLIGGAGSDRLNGYGTTITNNSRFDYLTGGEGADYFILGGQWGVSYVEEGDGYAIIQDWDANADWIQVHGSASQYSLNFKNVLGGADLDTEIYYNGGGKGERIGILQDTTNVDIARNFTFV